MGPASKLRIPPTERSTLLIGTPFNRTSEMTLGQTTGRAQFSHVHLLYVYIYIYVCVYIYI